MAQHPKAESLTLHAIKQIFDQSDAMAAVVDAENLALVYTNPAAQRFYGYSEQEIYSANLMEIINSTTENYRGYINKVLNSELNKIKFKHRKKSGELVSVITQTSPITVDGKSCILSLITDISASERAENELQQQKEWLNSVLQATHSGIVIIDKEEHTIVDLNRAAFKIIGGSLDKIIGRRCHSFICPNDEGNCPITDKKMTVINEERTVLSSNGDRIPIIKSVIEKEINGRKYLIESFIDISDRKILENQLLSERNFLDSLLNSLPVPVFYKGTDGRYLGCNKAYEEAQGISANRLKGMTVHELLPSTIADMHEDEDRQLIAGEALSISRETKMTTSQGEVYDVLFTKAPFYDLDGRVQGVIGSFLDITKRKQAEQEVVQGREFQKALLNSLSNPIFFMGRDGRYLGCNPAFERFKSIKERDLIGKSVFDLEAADLARVLRDKDQRIFDGIDSSQVFESAVTTPDGRTKHVLIHKSPFFSIDGSVLGLIGSFIDITDRKKQEEEKQNLIEQLITSKEIIEDSLYQKNALLDELTTAHDELRHANAEKDRVLSIITRDLKDPFVALLNNSDMLETYFYKMENEQKLKLISGIKSATNYSYSLLDNLLLWARTQIGDIEIIKDYVNVSDMVNNAIFVLNNNIADKKIDVQTEFLTDDKAFCDKNLLSFVLKNIIANAIKYSWPGNRVFIRTKQEQRHIEISVEDSGVGIGDESLPKLFLFTESVRTPGTANELGTGLSLIITKSFVEMNSGAILISSTPNYGTKVVFTVPTAPAED